MERVGRSEKHTLLILEMPRMKMGGKQRAEMTGEGWRKERDSTYSRKISISVSISIGIRIKPARRHGEAICRRRHAWMMIYVIENLGWFFFFFR